MKKDGGTLKIVSEFVYLGALLEKNRGSGQKVENLTVKVIKVIDSIC